MLWTPDSNAHEALGYRFTFVRSEVSVTDSNSLMSDGRVHIVYKYVEGISRLKQKSKRPRPAARRAEDGGHFLEYILIYESDDHNFFRRKELLRRHN